ADAQLEVAQHPERSTAVAGVRDPKTQCKRDVGAVEGEGACYPGLAQLVDDHHDGGQDEHHHDRVYRRGRDAGPVVAMPRGFTHLPMWRRYRGRTTTADVDDHSLAVRPTME